MSEAKKYQQISADGNARQHNGDSHNNTTSNYYGTGSSSGGKRLLHAALDGDIDRLRFLVEQRGLDVESEDEEGLTALHCAAWRGSAECVDYLMQKGAYVHHRNDRYGTPMTLAAFKQHTELFAGPFCKHGVKADVSGASGGLLGSPLHVSLLTTGNDPSLTSYILRWLIGRGAPVDDVREINYDFARPLADDFFPFRQHSQSSRTKSSTTGAPIHFAVTTPSPRLVEELIELGADAQSIGSQKTSTGDRNGVTPLMLACTYSDQEHLEICKYLLQECNADTKLRDSEGNDAVMLAARSGAIENLKLLVDWNVQTLGTPAIDNQSKSGRTALMKAARAGRAACVEYLLSQGASTELKSKDGNTAGDLARAHGWKACD